jgi:hypothetical protein
MARAPLPGSIAVRPLTRGMRTLLTVATVLVLLAGVALVVFSTRTAEWFAWTIDVPLTAAVLGSAYLASAVVEATSSRARAWVDARVAVPGVFAFTALTLVVTLVHLDRFHLQPSLAAHTRAIALAWIAIYAIVPVAMAVLWVRQQRQPGADPPRSSPLPPSLQAAVTLSAAGLLAYGAALLLLPEQAGAAWPWPQTPLTARATGAWLVGLGVTAAQVALEGDARRARPVAAGGVTLVALIVVSLLRFPDAVEWGSTAAWVLVAALSAWAAISAAVLVLARSPDDRATG